MTKTLEEHHYQRIAFNLVTSRNQKARRRVFSKNVGARALPACGAVELELLGFSPEEVGTIRGNYLGAAEAEVENARANGIDIIFKEDPDYPPGLLQIYDPPDFIYSLGNRELLQSGKIAVVGSRKGGPYGWRSLNRLVPDLCRGGLTIVSGMAYGIDSMAHKIALREGGNTIGVNAGGLLRLYPVGNRALIDQIRTKGCIISEFALDTIPRPFYFPIRNRIITGISRGILVVEASFKSGSLITARLGLEQNRDIFAVPGCIDSPVSEGTNYLIQQGAKLVTAPRDILDDYGIKLEQQTNQPPQKFTKQEAAILELMADGELKTVDHFAEQLEDYSISSIISLLMGLILKNVVMEESGGYRRI